MQPVVVASALGAGRAGCFCAVAVAHELVSESGPSFVDGWSYDLNILDLVSSFDGHVIGITYYHSQCDVCLL